MANRIQRAIQAFSSPTMSIGDPGFAGYIQFSRNSLSEMSELIALRQPAIWRAISLLASTIASLPLNTYRTDDNGDQQRVGSFLDNPAPYGLTRFSWMQLVMMHILLNGELGFIKIKNNAGATIQLLPVHANNYVVQRAEQGKVFKVTMNNGKTQDYLPEDFLQVMWMSLDGDRGISPLNTFRRTIQLMTGEQTAATRSITNGNLIGGLITADEDIDEDTATGIVERLKEKITGAENAGGIAFLNKKLKLTPWQMSNVDAQFLQGREFSIEEVGRIWGIPNHLLGQSTKDTSWGSGLQEQISSWQKYTLQPYTNNLEEAFSQLLPSPRFAKFDFHELLQGTPTEQLNALLAATGKPLYTVNESRKMLNMPPIDGGDVIAPALAPPTPEQTPSQDVLQKASAPVPASVKAFTKRITKTKKGSNGELITTTEEI